MGGKTANKAVYFDKLKALLEEYKSIFIVTVDNVSSQQMHKIRKSLRGEGVVLMGKNTMVCNQLSTFGLATAGIGNISYAAQVRRAIKGFIADFPEYERLLPHVKGILSAVADLNGARSDNFRQRWFHLHKCGPQQDPRCHPCREGRCTS